MPAPSAPLRILLVEDNRGDAVLTRMALDRAGAAADFSCAVSTADSIADACSVLARETPDVIVTDLSLPDGKGADVVTSLIAAAPGVPLVVLSGDRDTGVVAESLRRGASDYLCKDDFTGPVLIDALRRSTGPDSPRTEAVG